MAFRLNGLGRINHRGTEDAEGKSEVWTRKKLFPLRRFGRTGSDRWWIGGSSRRGVLVRTGKGGNRRGTERSDDVVKWWTAGPAASRPPARSIPLGRRAACGLMGALPSAEIRP